jgi:hypothetical protein
VQGPYHAHGAQNTLIFTQGVSLGRTLLDRRSQVPEAQMAAHAYCTRKKGARGHVTGEQPTTSRRRRVPPLLLVLEETATVRRPVDPSSSTLGMDEDEPRARTAQCSIELDPAHQGMVLANHGIRSRSEKMP